LAKSSACKGFLLPIRLSWHAPACRIGTVVTEEALKENAAKIPNVCEYFGIKWTNVQGFLLSNDWKF